MKIIYEAEDGTRFTSAKECNEYERKTNPPKFLFYNEHLKPVNKLSRTKLMVLPSYDAVTQIRDYLEQSYVSDLGIQGPGAYVFNELGYWEDVSALKMSTESYLGWLEDAEDLYTKIIEKTGREE